MSAPVPELAGFRADATVVGGSAGAIGVLTQILPRLPATLGTPVIVVLHVPPRRTSLLPELFAPRCALPVREPQDKQHADRGIWFAPADYHLLVETDRHFALSIDGPVNFSRPSIDVLFESAAHAYTERLLCIVLSGANEDGAAGARTIRQFGGMVVVQDPNMAEASEMPWAAVRRASPQYIAPVQELASVMIMASGGIP